MNLLNQQIAIDPVRAGHQGGKNSGFVNPMYKAKFEEGLRVGMWKQSILPQLGITWEILNGTNEVTNNRMGHTDIAKMYRNETLSDTRAPTLDNWKFTIDSPVYARNNEWFFDQYQRGNVASDFLEKIAADQAIRHQRFEDFTVLGQYVKACQIGVKMPRKVSGNALVQGYDIDGGWNPSHAAACVSDPDNTGKIPTFPTEVLHTAPEGFRGGTCVTLAEVGDEKDGVKLFHSLQLAKTILDEKDMDNSMMTFAVMRPRTKHLILSQAKELFDVNYSPTSTADYNKGEVLHINGIPIITTNRLPSYHHVTDSDNGQHHFLSNANNNYSYDINIADASIEILLFQASAVRCAKVFDVQANRFYDEKLYTHFIDSVNAFGCAPEYYSKCVGVFNANVGATTVTDDMRRPYEQFWLPEKDLYVTSI